MAKDNSIFDFRGNFGEITFVNSRAYGKHTRKRRGSNKPAPVNEEFKKAQQTQASANVPAKMIKDALDPFRKNFKDGKLWNNLVSHFQKNKGTSLQDSVLQLEGFDLYKPYSLDRILNTELDIIVNKATASLTIRITTPYPPNFKNKNIDGYRLTVIGIFPDMEKKTAVTSSIESPIKPLKDTADEVNLALPENSKVMLICLKIEGSMGGRISDNLKMIGMRIVKGMVVG